MKTQEQVTKLLMDGGFDRDRAAELAGKIVEASKPSPEEQQAKRQAEVRERLRVLSAPVSMGVPPHVRSERALERERLVAELLETGGGDAA